MRLFRTQNRILSSCLTRGCSLLFLLFLAQSVTAIQLEESTLKATLVVNLMNYVQWPSAAFNTEKNDYVVCFLGDSPVYSELIKLKGSVVNQHPVDVKVIATEFDITGCHVIYIENAANILQNRIIELTRTKPILTIADEKQKLSGKVLIELVEYRAHIGYVLELTQSEQRTLTILPKLINLATDVRR